MTSTGQESRHRSESDLSQLKDAIRAMSLDIHKCDEAWALEKAVGEFSEEINTAKYGAFFGAIQNQANQTLIMALARIYDSSSMGRRGNHSLAYCLGFALDWLQSLNRRAQLSEQDLSLVSTQVQSFASKYDYKGTLQGNASDEDIARFPLESARRELKKMRNGHLAHRSASPAEFRIIRRELTALLALPKAFVGYMGSKLLGVAYEINGEYILTSDSEASARCGLRVLRDLGILTKEQYRNRSRAFAEDLREHMSDLLI